MRTQNSGSFPTWRSAGPPPPALFWKSRRKLPLQCIPSPIIESTITQESQCVFFQPFFCPQPFNWLLHVVLKVPLAENCWLELFPPLVVRKRKRKPHLLLLCCCDIDPRQEGGTTWIFTSSPTHWRNYFFRSPKAMWVGEREFVHMLANTLVLIKADNSTVWTHISHKHCGIDFP